MINVSYIKAFDLKARQQLAVVMDRRSLHKSRLESEALRRLESSTFLAASFDNHSPQKGGKSHQPTRPLSAGNSRYVYNVPYDCIISKDFIYY